MGTGKNFISAVMVTICVVTVGIMLIVKGLVINMSDSMPHWGFLMTRFPVERDDLAIFTPPVTAQYDCPFIKHVVGLPGDEVVFTDGCFSLISLNNSRWLGCPKSVSEDGEKLEASTPGVIPLKHFWVHSDHPDSYDSRYLEVGLIHESAFMGEAIALGGPNPPPLLAWIAEIVGDDDAPPACEKKSR